ncbi:OmpA family protein [Schaalia odontolytica]|uniref:Photosystem I P700 chlorophyll a apoprotein A2 n=1 Tax=Schaalia odontolytica TaxID=1660 RepID=A0A2X0VEZ6_9ACTO|nr:OmpA family protein [Schaalia odontolytica]WMS28143.1 OmpA family protein [Schaalia odontolytica]SPT56087.1 Photosystem I P700 chlorophyll a apoprotein A2 [Schaalia odontolytica]
MNTARSTLTVITLAAATTLALGACAASKPQDPAASQSAATSSPTPSPTTTDTVPTVPGYRPGEIPPVPLFSVPSMDVFASNADKAVIQTASSSLQSVPGITVSPAKCDGNALISGSTVFGGDGSASTSTGNGVIINNGNGAGSIVEGPITITYGGDGSGSYVNSDTHVSLFILSDGGGTYSAGPVSVFIDSRGYGNYSNSETDESIVNNGDGSGNYSVGKTLIYNNRDGSGSYSDGTLSIINYGDGTALVNGVRITDAPKVEPLPALGKFPPVESLKPVESCGTVITLEDGVLFDFGKSDIRPDAAHTLSKLATVLNDAKVPAAHIYGHTDSVSDEAFNQQLSEDRANAVSAELKKDGASATLDATGYGETKPIAPNENPDGSDNPAGRALNRRVEIFIPAF